MSKTDPTVLGTSEARRTLPDLVSKAVAASKSAPSIRARAVEIRPRGQNRSASLVPTIDLEAAEKEIARLKDELENAGLALFLLERLGQTTGERLGEDQFMAEIGMTDFAEELADR